MSSLPLEGIRVIDATMFWAGPYLTNLLGNLGAEVIKVEAVQRLDGWRSAGLGRYSSEKKFWEWSPLWNQSNTDKLGITLDLARPEGAAIFKELVKIGDIVAENFTPRVMSNFGLDYPALKEVNPGLIMISLPTYGSTGPLKEFVGFGYSIEQMAGISYLTGFPDGLPRTNANGLTDPTAGVNGMIAVLFALLFRQETGQGQYIDLAQVEALTCLIGSAVVDYSMNERVQMRLGNRNPLMAPHGCYRCKGDDLWVAIAVSSDEEWHQLCHTIGDLPWTREGRFASCAGRLEHQDELDKLVEEWTLKHDHYDVMNTLQGAEIAAGATLTSAELMTDPHLVHRGIFQTIDRAIVGSHSHLIPSAAERLSDSPREIRRPAPLLGEHNEYVLGTLLGKSSEEIRSLAAEHIIGDAPLGR